MPRNGGTHKMLRNGGTRKKPQNGGTRKKPPIIPRVTNVPSATVTFINSLQQQIKCQQKHIKALRTQASFQHVQLEWYNQHLKPLKSSKYICWACDKNFTRQDHFHKHVRDTKDGQHQVITDFINQTFCLQCDTSFQRPGDLVKHEQKHDIERPKDRIRLLAESDPESENTTLNLQVSFGVTPAGEHNPTTYPNNPETISIPSASVIPASGWPVPEPQFSSAQYIGLPMADYSAALGNGFLDSPYDDSQSQGGWTMSEPGFSSAQYVGLPYSTALGNGFLDTPYDGLQSQGAWKILGPGFSSAQYVGLPPAEHSTALGNESMHHDGLRLG